MAFRADPDGDQFFALRTYRASGRPAVTPVWLAEARGRWYCYTPSRSWKVTRIRRDPRVAVARSDFYGEPRGPWTTGRARILPRVELGTARRVLTVKYGHQFRILRLVLVLGRFRRHGGPAVGLELTLDDEMPPARGDGARCVA